MRITNQMTINTLLLNLNKSVTSINKSMLQMATGQKIQMASEDPIIAALALRFRTNVAKTKQYKANTNQAESWMNVTEASISNTNKILQGIYDLCTEAASDTYNTDRKTLIDQISQFKKQLINEANSDYAGRYVFGGFKTDQKLMFTEEVKEKYNITQKFTKDHIETVKVPVPEEKQVLTGSYEEDNYLRGNGGKEVTEVKRIKLPYHYATNLKFTDSDGNAIEGTYINSENTVLSGDFEAYRIGDDDIKYVADTGEILIGKNIAQKLEDTKNFNLSYDKENFKAGDLNPIQYFDCRKYMTGETRLVNNTLITPKPDVAELTINYGNNGAATLTNGINSLKSTDDDAYKVQPDEIRYLTDTGEILFGKNIADEIKATNNVNVAYKNQAEIFEYDGTKEFPNSITIPTKDATAINLTFTSDGINNSFSSLNNIAIKKSTDENSRVVSDDGITYLSDTGEILFGKNVLPSVTNAEDLTIKTTKGEQTQSFELDATEIFDKILTIPNKDAAKLEVKIGESNYTLDAGITKVKSTDENAYAVGENEIKYISDTGELVFGKNVLADVSVTQDLKVTTQDAPQDVKEYKSTFNAVEKYPKSLTIGTQDATKINLSFTGTDGVKKIFSSEDAANKINIKTSSDENASLVGDNEITYLSDTGEVIFGKNILKSISQATDLNINAITVTGEVETPKEFKFDGTKEFSNSLKIPVANGTDLEIEANGKIYDLNSGITSVTSKDTNAYKVGDNEIKYITDTGELIFGKNINLNLESGINITSSYGISEVGELISNKTNDKMEYEFGTDNKMDININGSDVFTWELIADLDDLVVALGSVTERTADEIKEQLKKDMGEDYNKLTEDELSKIVADIQEGEEKTCREVLASRFSSAITKIQNHNEHATLTRSELGSRMKRLDLISERLENDKVTYTDLMTSNEGVDYEETVMQYMSQQAIYNSALSVGSQIIQKSLVDFI